jgi:dihydrofolate synthase/folylpolyglutamate synthase
MPTATQERYSQTLDYLFSRLPMFSRIGAAALKNDLSNTLALCSALNNPQHEFRSIHIAGTNGKGSTSHMLAAVMQAAGFKTGLYTSPHLLDFRERIRIDGQPVSKEFVIDFVERHSELIEQVKPSFFEITVAMAFVAFADDDVDIAIIETGLGGRLDSTNVILPELSVITNISLDHTDLLGDTTAAIAKEKAGIIKPQVPVVIGPCTDEAMEVFRERAEQLEAPVFSAGEAWQLHAIASDEPGQAQFLAQTVDEVSLQISTDLTGSYQQENIATALASIHVMKQLGWALPPLEQAVEALRNVRATTGLRGRWERLRESPLVIADVAHNPAGLTTVLRDWQNVSAKNKHIVLGFVRDKDVPKALSLFPKDAVYHFCAANLPRALPAKELVEAASKAGLQGSTHESVKAAVEAALSEMSEDDALLITGSFFIVAEVMEALG